MPKLGINIDHVATLRQARREFDPDPIKAAQICEEAGADSIVAHLREDSRHINDKDVRQLKKIVTTRLNLEMSTDAKIVRIAANIKPHMATLVPEKREEITTEGGLNVDKHFKRVANIAETLHAKGVEVSLFIDPVKKQIKKTKEAGIHTIEMHTGQYDHAKTKTAERQHLKKIKDMTAYAQDLGLHVSAGHGLKYHNTRAIAKIPGIEELNIGHSIISYAVFVGLRKAVKEMLKIVKSRS